MSQHFVAVLVIIVLFSIPFTGNSFAGLGSKETRWVLENGALCREGKDSKGRWTSDMLPWMAFIASVESRALGYENEGSVWVDTPEHLRLLRILRGTVTGARVFAKDSKIPRKYHSDGRKVLWVLLRDRIVRKVFDEGKLKARSQFPWSSAFIFPFIPREERRLQGGRDCAVWVDTPGLMSHLKIANGRSQGIESFRKGETIPRKLRSRGDKVLWVLSKGKLYRKLYRNYKEREQRVYPVESLPIYSFIMSTEMALNPSSSARARLQCSDGEVYFQVDGQELLYFGRKAKDAAIVRQRELSLVNRAKEAASSAVYDDNAEESENALEKILSDLSTLQDKVARLSETSHEAGRENPLDSPFILSAVMSFAWVKTDDYEKGGRNRSPYGDPASGEVDSSFFDVPLLRLSISKALKEGLSFHTTIDADSTVSGDANVSLVSAYVVVDEFLAEKLGAKMGYFGGPLKQDEAGHFINCAPTISDSPLGEFVADWEGWGLELSPSGRAPGRVDWQLGILSGTDTQDSPKDFVGIVDGGIGLGGELDDNIGAYLHVQKSPQRDGQIGWHASYGTTGGDTDESAPDVSSNEVDFLSYGARWKKDDLLCNAAYLKGDWKGQGAGEEADFDMFYLLVNYAIDKRSNVALRYDGWDVSGTDESSGHSWTMAYNRQLSLNSSLQLEYLAPKEDEEDGRVDENDSLLQAQYNFKF